MGPIAVRAWSMITPLGTDDETLAALFKGCSGFSARPSSHTLRSTLAASIPHRPRRATTDKAWQHHLAVTVGRATLAKAGINVGSMGQRIAFVFATSYGHLLDDPNADTMSTWAGECARSLGSDADPVVVGSACSSSADAIGMAAALLDAHMADLVVVIAVDIVTEAKRLAHSMLGTLTDGRHTPFDVARSGMLLGEAAAAAVLGRAADGRPNEGELVGAGASNDAAGLTAPDRSGASVRLAMDRALLSSGLSLDDLSLYLAHGTATILNDEVETKVLVDLFGARDDLVVLGTKGALGHSLGACGLVEFIILLGTLNAGAVPATVGLVNPIPEIAGRFPTQETRALSSAYGVSVTLGFGGFNTALIARARTMV